MHLVLYVLAFLEDVSWGDAIGHTLSPYLIIFRPSPSKSIARPLDLI